MRTFDCTVQDEYARKLAAQADEDVHTHPSPIYGTGFRRALKSYHTLGSLRAVLDHLRHHMDLPVSECAVRRA